VSNGSRDLARSERVRALQLEAQCKRTVMRREAEGIAILQGKHVAGKYLTDRGVPLQTIADWLERF